MAWAIASGLRHDPVALHAEVDASIGARDARLDDVARLQVLPAPGLALEKHLPLLRLGKQRAEPLLGRRRYRERATRRRAGRDEIPGVEVVDARQLGQRL